MDTREMTQTSCYGDTRKTMASVKLLILFRFNIQISIPLFYTVRVVWLVLVIKVEIILLRRHLKSIRQETQTSQITRYQSVIRLCLSDYRDNISRANTRMFALNPIILSEQTFLQ